MISGVLLDIGGVLHEGERATDGGPQALAALRRAGVPLRFATNTSRCARAAVAERLRGLGYAVEAEQILTAPRAAAQAVTERGLRPYLIAHPDLEPDLRGLETRNPGAVLIADAAEQFTYRRLNAAFRLLLRGAPLLAVARNRYFQEEDGLSLDMGPFVAALEYASGAEAELYGKPAAAFFRQGAAELGLPPHEVLMVGDDVEADVQGALAAGLQAALVRTGKYRPGDERAGDLPFPVFDSLAEVVRWLLAPDGAPVDERCRQASSRGRRGHG